MRLKKRSQANRSPQLPQTRQQLGVLPSFLPACLPSFLPLQSSPQHPIQLGIHPHSVTHRSARRLTYRTSYHSPAHLSHPKGAHVFLFSVQRSPFSSRRGNESGIQKRKSSAARLKALLRRRISATSREKNSLKRENVFLPFHFEIEIEIWR